MIDRSTNIQAALRSRQRGFLLNPFRFGSTPPPSYPLDLYPGAAIAYSLRKLRSAYTGPAIRARRASDFAQLDIGFNADGTLDTSALLAFAGANETYVHTWYDQSGNARNASTTDSTYQPVIAESGAVHTANGRHAITFDKFNDRLPITSAPSTGQVYSAFCVGYATGAEGVVTLVGGAMGSPQFRFNSGSAVAQLMKTNSALLASCGAAPLNVVRQATFMTTSTASSVRINAGAYSGSGGAPNFTQPIAVVGSSNASAEFFGGPMQEIIIYTTDQSSARNAIEADQVAYYSIA